MSVILFLAIASILITLDSAAVAQPPFNDPCSVYQLYETSGSFANVFELWVSDHVLSRWDTEDFNYFIEKVLDDDPDNSDDIFPKVWDYLCFGDTDPSYDGVEFVILSTTYDKIIIRLFDRSDVSSCCSYPVYGNECNGYSYLTPRRWFDRHGLAPDRSSSDEAACRACGMVAGCAGGILLQGEV